MREVFYHNMKKEDQKESEKVLTKQDKNDIITFAIWTISSAGMSIRLTCGGHRFKSCIVHQ